ncbi:MAG: hypothetical protein HYY93_08150 [Planctomycetes bacterium]|nr:hypothetical protein [Planctomycetota bacterium]
MMNRSSPIPALLALALSTAGLITGAWRMIVAQQSHEERDRLVERMEELELAGKRRPALLRTGPAEHEPATSAVRRPVESSPAPSADPDEGPAAASTPATAESGKPGEMAAPLWAPPKAKNGAEELYRSSYSLSPPKDREAIEAAIALEPENPKYRAALIVNLWNNEAERPRLRAELEQLDQIDRDNALAPYCLAHLAKEAGDPASARRWAEEALSRPALRMYAIAEAEARLANLLDTKPDASPEAIMGVLFSTMLPALVPIRNTGRFMTEAADAALAAGNLEEARRLAEAPMSLARQMEGQPAFHIDRLVALSVESNSLDASRRIAEAQGDTARIEEIDRAKGRIAFQRDLFRRISIHTDYVFTSGGISAADIREYARRTIEEGEAAATLGMRPGGKGRR